MRFLRRMAVLLAVLLVAFTGFFTWASSGVLTDDERATVTVYTNDYPAPRDTFTVVTYNLGYLSGMTNNRPVARTAAFFHENMDAAAALLRQAEADVVAFQEIDFGASRSFEVHQLDTLAQRLGYAASAAAVNWDERYVPFPSANPAHHFGRILSGQGVLCRYPIRRHERFVLKRPDNAMSYPPPLKWLAGAFYIDRLAQVVVVDAGRPLVLINVHLEAWDTATRMQQAEQVRALYERYKDEYAVVLLGDFNSLLPAAKQSPQLSLNARSYFANDRTIETLLLAGGLREAFADSVYRTREADTFTSPADSPRAKIDHIFYEVDEIEAVSAYVIGGPDQPSDHRAVVMRFVFKK